MGMYQGFLEMQQAGITATIPRLAAVQAENCAPVYHAWRAGLTDVPALLAPGDKRPTIAEGISIAKPVKGRDILAAVYGSNGVVVPVSDDAIWRGVEALAHRGAYAEPTGAVAAAALETLLGEEVIQVGQRVVLVLTGSGLKATDRMAEHLASRL